jgi:hypothetical protein
MNAEEAQHAACGMQCMNSTEGSGNYSATLISITWPAHCSATRYNRVSRTNRPKDVEEIVIITAV